MNLTNNDLRAVAGIILLIIAITLMYSNKDSDVINYTILVLAGFLVGGQLLQKNDTNTTKN